MVLTRAWPGPVTPVVLMRSTRASMVCLSMRVS
jgi:hypothetical protein